MIYLPLIYRNTFFVHFLKYVLKKAPIDKNENFYKQEYCGCVYSLRDTNNWRQKNLRPKIEIGKNFYTHLNKKTSND